MNDLIKTIKESLDKADAAPWEQDEGPYVLNSNGHIVCRLWDLEDKYANDQNNANLIAKSPTWLQQLSDSLEDAVKALEWYGDKTIYFSREDEAIKPIVKDFGELARNTLKRIKGATQAVGHQSTESAQAEPVAE
ncbi:hypothetical protein [Paenibacillus sp. FSL R10-2771]|uniref:hypothetical protein n=1 Tax=Paenibacillus sp. FSL R10-2771 TaxID=2954693 RepID=UPI0030F7CA2A